MLAHGTASIFGQPDTDQHAAHTGFWIFPLYAKDAVQRKSALYVIL